MFGLIMSNTHAHVQQWNESNFIVKQIFRFLCARGKNSIFDVNRSILAGLSIDTHTHTHTQSLLNVIYEFINTDNRCPTATCLPANSWL